ncbi:MAG: hypothetical protein Q7K29_04305 [Thermoleophilia bacterium]|nr:hypothetical protein [Thermoleophilia bacterium]
MIANKRLFGLGFGMLLSFFVVLVLLFMPLWQGGTENGLNMIDDLFNRVSKSSSDFMEKESEEAKAEMGTRVKFTTGPVREADEPDKEVRTAQALRIAELFKGVEGTTVSVDGTKVKVEGDMGLIMEAVIADSTVAFGENEGVLQKKYGYPSQGYKAIPNRELSQEGLADEMVMYDWYMGIDNAQRDLTVLEEFDQSKVLMELNERSVEPAYNYYGIEASSPKNEWFALVLANIGYILYTVWYGFALLFMFEGWGLKLEH